MLVPIEAISLLYGKKIPKNKRKSRKHALLCLYLIIKILRSISCLSFLLYIMYMYIMYYVYSTSFGIWIKFLHFLCYYLLLSIK